MSHDVVIDDAILLQDRLMRSLHRNSDGHLAASKKGHNDSVLSTHNIATLYIYTVDSDEAYMMHSHYIYSHDPLSYRNWLTLVIAECFKVEDNKSDTYYGVYGWLTGFMRITPMRTGDLFIKISEEGAKGVRLAFNTAKNKHEAYKKKK